MDAEMTQRVRSAAQAAGADLVGIADRGRFDGVDVQRHPASIFPEVQSVIVIGKRVTRGCLRGVEEGTHLQALNTYALNWVPDRFLAETTVAVASFLEDHRYEAVPIPFLPRETPTMGVAVAPGRPLPNVIIDFEDAAVRAGLGALGAMGVLMTPRFGHRQVLQMILTDAKLAPDPVSGFDPCATCTSCADACPLGAVHKRSSVRILDRTYPVASVDKAVCGRCRNGAEGNRYHRAAPPHRMGAACMRACVGAVADKLEDRFALPFRQRPAWKIGPSGATELEVTP
jgi:epoxyqueuosine reductase QueG